MRSWLTPEIPYIPREEMPQLRLFDTVSGQVKKISEVHGAFGMYVCGITPYDATHIGHASTYLAFDLVNRAMRDRGAMVTYVQNVTDVDDPLLERAAVTGVDWRKLAHSQTDLFRSDMEALNIIAPNHYVGVVEAMDWIIDVIKKLLVVGVAYYASAEVTPEGKEYLAGDIYFNVKKASAPQHSSGAWWLGQISHMDRQQMLGFFQERGGDPGRAGKRDPLDPLLWRARREGEPFWEGGGLPAGRPGWHIECTAIADYFLQAPFELQGGGSDLIFPHHEMGAGHSFHLTARPVARHFMHTGMVGYQGEKMSKSLGNLVLVSVLIKQGADPIAIRLAIMMNHYQSEWFWTDDLLKGAQKRLELWRKAVNRAAGYSDSGEGKLEQQPNVIATIRDALANNLDTPAALLAVDLWAGRVLQGEIKDCGRAVKAALDALLGIKL